MAGTTVPWHGALTAVSDMQLVLRQKPRQAAAVVHACSGAGMLVGLLWR
jgi:hypothetical protein